MEIGLDVTGTSVVVLVNGVQVLTPTLSAANHGTFAIQGVSSTITIDDVRIRAR